MSRVSKIDYFMMLAELASLRATCIRRAVGCVLIDENDYVISTGYNGVPKGMPHCNEEHECIGDHNQSGQNLNECKALHAETNAVAHCSNPKEIREAYVTVSPCMSCMKLLLATPCHTIYSREIYDENAVNFWNINGRTLRIIK